MAYSHEICYTNNDENTKTTITKEIQVPGLGQAHKACGGVKHFCEYSTLPLTWDSGVTVEQENKQ